MTLTNGFANGPVFKAIKIATLKAAVVAIAVSLSACSALGVQPWERDLLAKDEMSLSAGATDLSLDDHISFSKEGTSGGRGFAGGGCGCN